MSFMAQSGTRKIDAIDQVTKELSFVAFILI
jgi:hypothetical protein